MESLPEATKTKDGWQIGGVAYKWHAAMRAGEELHEAYEDDPNYAQAKYQTSQGWRVGLFRKQ